MPTEAEWRELLSVETHHRPLFVTAERRRELLERLGNYSCSLPTGVREKTWMGTMPPGRIAYNDGEYVIRYFTPNEPVTFIRGYRPSVEFPGQFEIPLRPIFVIPDHAVIFLPKPFQVVWTATLPGLRSLSSSHLGNLLVFLRREVKP